MLKITKWRRNRDFVFIYCLDDLAFVGGEGYDVEIKTTLDNWSVSDDNVYTITTEQAESLGQLLTSKGFVVGS